MVNTNVMDIVSFKFQKIIAGCKEFLRSGKISAELRSAIYNLSPSEIDSIRYLEDANTRQILDIAMTAIKKQTESEISEIKKRINEICQSTLDSLVTSGDEYKIPSVMDRYRETINPVKALYYDLQEILFLYDEKPKNRHHINLIVMLRDKNMVDRFGDAIKSDLHSLDTCNQQINNLKSTYKVSANSTNAIKVIELRHEMAQWLKVLTQFYEFSKTVDLPPSWPDKIKSIVSGKKDVTKK